MFVVLKSFLIEFMTSSCCSGSSPNIVYNGQVIASLLLYGAFRFCKYVSIPIRSSVLILELLTVPIPNNVLNTI